MKKALKTLALALTTALGLVIPAFADVATGPMYAMIIGVPVAIIAIAVIVIVLVVKAVRRKKSADENKK